MIYQRNLLTLPILSLGLLLSCKDKEKITPTCTSGPEISLQATDATCNTSDGKIIASASGGEAPYEYSLNGQDFQTSSEFDHLGEGSFMITVRDKNKCSNTAKINVDEKSTIEVSFATENTTCGGSSGTITVTSSGGTGAHQYSLNGGAFQTDNVFANLNASEYSLTVKDESGCSKITTVQVLTGVSYATVIKPIIEGSCAIAGCHVAGNSIPDFTIFSNIKAKASRIKSKTGDRSMPKKGSLTDEQIHEIACWVDDGALNN